jgi:hypothetical protein
MVYSILFPAQILPKTWAKRLYDVQILILSASFSLYFLGVAPMVLGMRDLVHTLTNYNEFFYVTALAMFYFAYLLADTLYTSLGELSVEILAVLPYVLHRRTDVKLVDVYGDLLGYQ